MQILDPPLNITFLFPLMVSNIKGNIVYFLVANHVTCGLDIIFKRWHSSNLWHDRLRTHFVSLKHSASEQQSGYAYYYHFYYYSYATTNTRQNTCIATITDLFTSILGMLVRALANITITPVAPLPATYKDKVPP